MYGSGAVIRRRIVDEFTPLRAPVHRGFDDWDGADVVLATGWDTAYAAALLPGCRARAYLIQDHEPEFFATSAESMWAARTYELGFYGIAASRWLRDLLAARYGQRGSLVPARRGPGASTGRGRSSAAATRSSSTPAQFTPRRAVPLGALALEELHRRRPDTRFVLFGQGEEARMPFPYELLGVVSPRDARLALLRGHRRPLPVAHELLADPAGDDGLRPALRGPGGRQHRGGARDATAAWRWPRPTRCRSRTRSRGCSTIERAWQRRSDAGLALVEDASWDVAARQVEAGLREALREREPATESAPA